MLNAKKCENVTEEMINFIGKKPRSTHRLDFKLIEKFPQTLWNNISTHFLPTTLLPSLKP